MTQHVPPIDPPRDINDGAGANADIDRLRAQLADAEARERLLVHELQHRVQNMLALIRSIYRRSRDSDSSLPDIVDHFQGRLDAVARYHWRVDLSGSGIELEDMVRDELVDVGFSDGPNCVIDGPPVRLGGHVAELIGLAIHELATNAIKFGAIGRGGKLTVIWSVTEHAEGPLLDFRWSETGVTLVSSAPRPYGFGRQLIEEALPYQLGAVTSFGLKPGRFECSIQLALQRPTSRPDDRHSRIVSSPFDQE